MGRNPATRGGLARRLICCEKGGRDMIKSTYIRLAKAAELLGTDPDTLLIAATERSIRLFWLINCIVYAERGYFTLHPKPPPDEDPVYWVPLEYGHRHFMYIPLDVTEAAGLLRHETVVAQASILSEQDRDDTFWQPNSGWAVEGGGLSEAELSVTRDIVFVRSADVDKIRDYGAPPPAGTIKPQPTSPDRSYFSDKLVLMNQAAAKWWAHADRKERGTHPGNAAVTAWLEQRGFSRSLADKAATIIRPEWAPTGRKPEE